MRQGARHSTAECEGSEFGQPCGARCGFNPGLPNFELVRDIEGRWDRVPLVSGWLLQDNAACMRTVPDGELLVELDRAILIEIVLALCCVLVAVHLDREQWPRMFHTVQADEDGVLGHRNPRLVVGRLVSWLAVPNHGRINLDHCLDRRLLLQALNLAESGELFEAAGLGLLVLHVELHDLIHDGHLIRGIAVPPELQLHRWPL
mmetsp:Transcript_41689/g.116153  ORF Transcript_41689/g.116153 Transcript_41689/m.116153 type:complete len:204 (+) Transcript_41689:501-1112(+)